jgi:hypothetical protein
MEKRQLIPVRIDRCGNFFFRLNSSVSPNVVHLESAVEQYAAYEQPPVARGRIFLRAKHGDPVFPDSAIQPRQTFLKKRCCGDSLVENVAILVIKFVPVRAAA